MGFHEDIVTTRTTEPDSASLLNTLKQLDASANYVELERNFYRVKKNTPWTPAHINAARNAINNAPAASLRLTAQSYFDSLPIIERAIILTQLDQFNLIRSKLTPPMNPITEEQMIAAIRAKAGTL